MKDEETRRAAFQAMSRGLKDFHDMMKAIAEGIPRTVQVKYRPDMDGKPIVFEGNYYYMRPASTQEPEPSSQHNCEDMIEDTNCYNEFTLAKVQAALVRSGIDLDAAVNGITYCQNAGILFRERKS
jgi:hypothetical protein